MSLYALHRLSISLAAILLLASPTLHADAIDNLVNVELASKIFESKQQESRGL